MARDLIRRGEFVHVIEVDREGVRLLTPAGSWDVRGRFDPRDVALSLRSVRTKRQRHAATYPAAAVVHGQATAVDPARPWWGVGHPWGGRGSPASSMPTLRTRSQTRPAGTRGHLLPVPQGPDTEEVDADGYPDDPLADLRADIASAARQDRARRRRSSERMGRGADGCPAGGLEARSGSARTLRRVWRPCGPTRLWRSWRLAA